MIISEQHIDSIAKLGKMIRKTRKGQNLTLEEAAAICGVGVRFLRELEVGKESIETVKQGLIENGYLKSSSFLDNYIFVNYIDIRLTFEHKRKVGKILLVLEN